MSSSFADEANWLRLYDNLIIGANNLPIAPIILNNSLSHRFLRVTANNQDARSTWRLGAYVYLLVDEVNPQVEVSRLIAPVNIPAIFPIPDYLTSYRVKAVPPRWFKGISLQIDGYTGSSPSPNDLSILVL